jgi:transposase
MAYVDCQVAEDVSTVNLGQLALLRPLLQKLNIAAIIDRHIPTDAEFSHGTVLDVLLAARLHSPTALVNVAQWAQEHGVAYLWNIPPEKLNDDRLARALDAFFDKRQDILADITREVLGLSQLTLEIGHFDTTHIVLYGCYEDSVERPLSSLDRLVRDLRAAPAHITRGYLTRYKMLQFGITSVVDDLGAVPVACHVFDGNRNGHTGIAQQYHLLRHYLTLPDNLLLVSDRGTCSAEHLGRLLQHNHYALCAGQWQDYSPLYDQHADRLNWEKASYRSMEQQRRRDTASSLPLEEYRLAVVDHQLVDPTTKRPFACRVLFTHASAADRECKERRQKNIALITAGLEAIARKLERAHPTTTPESVAGQIQKLLGKKAAARHFRWQLIPLTDAESAALPPPHKGFRKQTHRLAYSLDEASVQAESRHDGIYALVTTAPLTWSGDALFTEYKRQTYVERGHHELKTPIAVAPIFLKKPHRVEALISLLFLALQAAMTLERLYRQRVPSEAPPAERRMTAERILRKFRVCGVTVTQTVLGELVRAAALSAEQRRILNHLSLPTPAKILQKILEPPPTS